MLSSSRPNQEPEEHIFKTDVIINIDQKRHFISENATKFFKGISA